MMSVLKKCKQCKEEKDLNEFYESKYTKDGVTNPCKECRKKYAKLHRSTRNPETLRRYREKNRDKIREYGRAYKAKTETLIKIFRDESPGIAFSEWRREYEKMQQMQTG